jgi:hypothetical protein
MREFRSHPLHRRLIALAAIPLQAISTAQVPHQPLPVAEVQLDGAMALEFCIVPLEIGDAPFATREFWLGGRGEGGFKEPPTRTLISGGVVLHIGGKPDWCLLMGKTEVTVAQWNAVMGLPAVEKPQGSLPATRRSKGEVMMFLEKLNERLHANRERWVLRPPVNGSLKQVFFRLPSEAEWEFAARGGRAVDATRFDSPTPYKDELNRIEWFAGQKSSKGQVKPVGEKAPNPLGLLDMLGNVSEMTENYYQIEYSQGRHGGLVLRGGDFRIDEKDVRASLRFETPCVSEIDGTAYRASHAGFRLAAGSLIMPQGAEIEKLEDAWTTHKDKRIQPATGVIGIASLRDSVTDETHEMRKQAEDMRRQIRDLVEKKEMGAAERDAAVARISTLEALIASLEGKVRRAEELSSRSAIRLGSMVSFNVTGDIITKSNTTDEKTLAFVEAKISSARVVVEDSCKLLGEVTPAVIEQQFQEWEAVLEKLGNERGGNWQLAATRAFRETAFGYIKKRRIDMDSWLASLTTIADGRKSSSR